MLRHAAESAQSERPGLSAWSRPIRPERTSSLLGSRVVVLSARQSGAIYPKKKVNSRRRFYSFADKILEVGGLDTALADFDTVSLGQVLEAYFLSLRNDPKLGAGPRSLGKLCSAFCGDPDQDGAERFLASLPERKPG